MDGGESALSLKSGPSEMDDNYANDHGISLSCSHSLFLPPLLEFDIHRTVLFQAQLDLFERQISLLSIVATKEKSYRCSSPSTAV